WNLYVVDDQQLDSGLIRSWTLEVFNRPVLTVTNTVTTIADGNAGNDPDTRPTATTPEDTAITFNVHVNDSDTPLDSLTLSHDIDNANSIVQSVSITGTGKNKV